MHFITICTGKKLQCAKETAASIGSEERDETKSRLEKIGNVSRPVLIKCLPLCEMQYIESEKSFAKYPQPHLFFYEPIFCEVGSHIWQNSCQNEDRRFFLDKSYPELCSSLKTFSEFFDKNGSCKEEDWPRNFMQKHGKPDITLSKAMYQYASENLAFVHVFIQSPYVTKIQRDVAMTMISYIANMGGLLGLCLGFSLISLIEILFWCFCCCKNVTKDVCLRY